MAFRAQFDGGKCPKCLSKIYKDDQVRFNAADQLEHMDCDPQVEHAETDGAPTFVRWDNVTEESLERTGREDLEMSHVAPIGPQGVCPNCFLELPKTLICGYC